MSVLTANAMLMAPAGATAPALNLNGSAFAYGTWTQFIAVTAGQAQIAGVVVYPGTWASGTMDIDVGVGLAGAEVSLATPIRFELANSGGNGPTTYMLPAPISGIASGVAVSLRMRNNAGVTGAPLVKLIYYLNLDSDHQTAYVTGAHPVTAAPAVVTPSGAAWTPSTAVTLITSLTNNAYVYGLGILFPALGQESEFDICTGAAAGTVIDTLRGSVGNGAGGTFEPRLSYLHLPALKLVLAGTKVSVIMRHSSTSVATYKIALLYYDAPTPPAAPPPASDYPCNVKTPVFWSALSVAGSVFNASKAPLRDPGTYYGGYKPPRLASMGSITRAASDWLTGSPASQTASVKYIDADRYFRNLFTTAQADFIGSTLYCYLVSEATRLTQGNPSLLFRGPIASDPISEHLTYTVEANDAISVAFNMFRGDPQIPQRYLSYGDFPNATIIGPVANHLGIPIVYGSVSDESYGTPIGQIQAISVGNLVVGGTTYAVGLIAGHACAGGILNAYQNNALLTTWGTDVWAPGKSGWTTIQPSGALYFDINGHRYTLIFLTGAKATAFQDGSQPVYVNVNGIEPNGDGTGSVITDLIAQYKHAMVNWLTQSYQAGPWLSTPTFPFYPGGAATLDVLDTTTWDAASTIAGTYLGGGWVGGFVLGANGTRQSNRDVLQALNTSCNTMLGLDSSSRLVLSMLDRRRTQFLGSARTITDRRDILANPAFNIQKNLNWFHNTIAYPFKATYRLDGVATAPGDTAGPFQITAEAQTNVDSFSKRGDVTVTTPFHCIRDTATADAVATQRLAFAQQPPRMVTWAQSLCGMNFNMFSGVPITHYGGTGASGWVANAVWILGQQLDPSTNKVTFTGVDVNHLLS